ncbi:MAG: ABC transporter ATP-binding protein [Deltaproteobacteria bacterium]|nr:ABC transporter ATP-binding protein [Deltaproteobacteria bacterium]
MLEVLIQKRLDGFRLDVAFAAEHELIVLFGPSGAGKSLTLQAIAGTVQPDVGCIVIDDQTVYDSARSITLSPQARRVGYVPQHYALFPHLTAAENISFGLTGLPRRERERRVEELITLFGLQGLERRRPHELSGGQQQRVALARALAAQPRLLLLDEPFAALDAPLRGALREELARVQARTGITVLMVTHDLADAFALGQRIIVYDGGQVIQQGTRDEVFFHPATRRVAEFVGTGNILPAVVEHAEEGTLWLRWQGHRLAVAPAPLAPGTPVFLCVRPTQILVVRPDRLTERERENLLCGHIVGELMQAETYTLHLRLDGSSAAYDLELALPGYVYHRLSLDREKRIMVELRRQVLHVIPRE